jgi:hypothetical protein
VALPNAQPLLVHVRRQAIVTIWRKPSLALYTYYHLLSRPEEERSPVACCIGTSHDELTLPTRQKKLKANAVRRLPGQNARGRAERQRHIEHVLSGYLIGARNNKTG